MADILCSKCGAVHDEKMPCIKSRADSDILNSDLSEVTVKELSSGDIVYYRPPDDTNFSADPLPENDSATEVDGAPLFTTIAEVLNPFAYDFYSPPEPEKAQASTPQPAQEPAPEKLETPTPQPAQGSAPVSKPEQEKKPAPLVMSAPEMPARSSDGYSELGDFLLPDEPKKPSAELSLEDFNDDLADGAKPKATQDIFEHTFKPVNREEAAERPASPILELKELMDPHGDPITALGWVGIIFLMLIPVLNLLLLIVWACGGCQKRAKASFARAALLVLLIIAIIVAIAYFAFGSYISGFVRGLLIQDGVPSGLMMSILGILRACANLTGIDLIITPTILT